MSPCCTMRLRSSCARKTTMRLVLDPSLPTYVKGSGGACGGGGGGGGGALLARLLLRTGFLERRNEVAPRRRRPVRAAEPMRDRSRRGRCPGRSPWRGARRRRASRRGRVARGLRPRRRPAHRHQRERERDRRTRDLAGARIERHGHHALPRYTTSRMRASSAGLRCSRASARPPRARRPAPSPAPRPRSRGSARSVPRTGSVIW